MKILKKKWNIKYILKNGIIISIALSFVFAGILIFWLSFLPIPDIASFSERRVEQSTKIYDRTGEVVLFDFVGDRKRTFVPLDDISRHVKNATIAIEDSKFYEHNGIRPLAIVRASFSNVFSLGFNQGGSTITQQLIKNTVLTFDKKVSRKLKEWVLAVKLENVLEKDQILELYLNEIPYGGNLYGVFEASQTFFNKHPRDLTIVEAAYIASLPKSPTFLSPYGNNLDALEARKDVVINRMFDLGIITEEELNDALSEEVAFAPQVDTSIKAPHFVFFVRNELEKIYGIEDISVKGLKVITSLDWELQNQLQDIVTERAFENEEKFNAENAGAVLLSVEEGEILAMVGSRNYFDEDIDGKVNVTLASRQPGSVFKPFAYAAAFAKGFTADTILFDVETQFHESCDANFFESNDLCYSPKNYDNVFRGPVSMRDALAQSINIPAVKTLFLAGLQNTFNLAKNIGLSTLSDPLRYGLTLVLGGGEVRLIDVTNAYASFGREGEFITHKSILEIDDGNGKIPVKERRSEQVVDKNVARMINDVLSDNVARAPAFGENSALRFDDYDVAVKTGTTNDYRDAWIVGYSNDVALGVWAGNNDNSPMEKRVAGFIVAPMWQEMMRLSLEKYGSEEEGFNISLDSSTDLKPILRGNWTGNSYFETDRISGGLATDDTPFETRERQYIFEPHNILHWVSPSDPRGDIPQNPEFISQYRLWEYGVQDWVQRNVRDEDRVVLRPDFDDNVHIDRNKPEIRIINPQNGRIFDRDDIIDVSFTGNGRYPITSYELYINDNLVSTSNTSPLFSFVPEDIDGINVGKNTISFSVIDSIYNKTTKEIDINIR